MRLCGTLGYAFAKSSQTTPNSDLDVLASVISWDIAAVCSAQPENPAIPPFWIVVSMYLLTVRNSVSRLEITDQNIFPSTLRSEISLN